MELHNLQEIFNERMFRIPDYQRGYSWNKQQWNDLWRDIQILREGQDHYTGVLSVVHNEDGNTGKKNVSVVDGQQRITTLIILIHVLCHSKQVQEKEWINLQEKSGYIKKYLHFNYGQDGKIKESVFGYEKDNPSHIYFKKQILGLSDSDSSVPTKTFYTRNLGEAKSFFTSKVENLTFEQIEILLKKVTEQLKFNYYQIDNSLNQFVAFETMNNRGKPLSTLELLKNRLIYLSTLLSQSDDNEKDELRKDINNAWKTVYEFLGRNSKKPLDDDDFLKNHWIMKFSYSRDKSKVYRNFLLNEHFTAEQVANRKITYDDIHNYAEDIQKASKTYYYLHYPEDTDCPYDGEIKKWLSKMNRLGFGAFRPIITSVLMHSIEKEKILRLLKLAEQFVFVAFNVHFHRASKKDSDIYSYASRIHANPNLGITDQFSLGYLDISDHLEVEEFLKDIKDYDSGFYDWKGLKYFLYEYEIALQESHQGGEIKVQWENVNTETIEHIYPQTSREGWEHFSSKDKALLHDLGNLLLLSRKKNSSLQNRPFSEKKESFKTDSYSAIEVAQNEQWDPDTIKSRQDKMLEFLLKRWDLKKQEPDTNS